MSVSFLANRRGLLTGSMQDGIPELTLWDLETGQPRWQLSTNGFDLGLCSPTDANLALAMVGQLPQHSPDQTPRDKRKKATPQPGGSTRAMPLEEKDPAKT